MVKQPTCEVCLQEVDEVNIGGICRDCWGREIRDKKSDPPISQTKEPYRVILQKN